MFLRGVGGNSAGIGQIQGDAIRNIYGELDWNANSSMGSGVFSLKGSDYGAASNSPGPNFPDSVIFDASKIVPTANENRPVNKAVRYLIRAQN